MFEESMVFTIGSFFVSARILQSSLGSETVENSNNRNVYETKYQWYNTIHKEIVKKWRTKK